MDTGHTPGRAQILDACCGGRMWWWDKAHPLAIYMDKHELPPGSSFRPNWSCEPDLIGDFRAMPFEDGAFQLVVFDPPHLTRKDPTAVLRAETGIRYGVLRRDSADDDLRRGFAECWRVLAPGGTLVFKWGGKVDRVRRHFPTTPIVGTRSLRKSSGLGTRWFIFYKPLLSIHPMVTNSVVCSWCHARPEEQRKRLRAANVASSSGDFASEAVSGEVER